MGGASTEISAGTTDVVIEAAHFDAMTVARMSRRHKLSSEASRRFERGVDPAATYAAAHRVAQLLVELAGGTLSPDETVRGSVLPQPTTVLADSLPGAVLGAEIGHDQVVELITAVGARVQADGGRLTVTAPTWRPDLRDPYDYVEEVGRLIGFETIAPVVPQAPVGRGLTRAQRARRAVNAAVAGAGFVEVLSFSFASIDELDKMGGAGRRRAAPVEPDRQPAVGDQPVPADHAVARAVRGRRPQPEPWQRRPGPVRGGLGVLRAPAAGRRAATAGDPTTRRGRTGGHGSGARPAAATPGRRGHGAVVGTRLVRARDPGRLDPGDRGDRGGGERRRSGARAPRRRASRPGTPAGARSFLVDGQVLGYAGEIHPEVCLAFGLPPRTAAAEIDLDALVAAAPTIGEIRPISGYPVAKEDVALIVDVDVPAAAVERALRAGAGPLLESVTLFDVYTGPQVGEGKKSLAYALRFRAPDRTLTEAEAAAARDAAVVAAAEQTGAVQRTI